MLLSCELGIHRSRLTALDERPAFSALQSGGRRQATCMIQRTVLYLKPFVISTDHVSYTIFPFFTTKASSTASTAHNLFSASWNTNEAGE